MPRENLSRSGGMILVLFKQAQMGKDEVLVNAYVACRLEKASSRRHAVKGRGHFAFSDVRRMVNKAAMDDNFAILCPTPRKSVINSLETAFMRMAA